MILYHRRSIDDDVEVIRVQREIREKSDQLLILQTQYSALEKVQQVGREREREREERSNTSCCTVTQAVYDCIVQYVY